MAAHCAMIRPLALAASVMMLGGWQPAPDFSATANARLAEAVRLRQTTPSRQPAIVPHQKASGSITTFDAPNAGTGFYQGTFPLTINKSGLIAGTFTDRSATRHGFLVDTAGNFTVFDAPGDTGGTYPVYLDDSGAMIGTYLDANGVSHGFSRTADGTITVLTGPGGLDLLPGGINQDATLAGTYVDAGGVLHGFRLLAGGKFKGYEAPGAGTLPGQGTDALAIAGNGQIAGRYRDLNGRVHPYRRTVSGVITTLTLPGGFEDDQGFTYAPFEFEPPLTMNVHGLIAGNYFQAQSGNPLGGDLNVFLQTASGAVTTFGIGDTGPCCTFTYMAGLNASGTVAGYDNDYYALNHGYVRTPDGTITTFDAPGAGTQLYQGTQATAINAGGTVTGAYTDNNYTFHGFVRQP